MTSNSQSACQIYRFYYRFLKNKAGMHVGPTRLQIQNLHFGVCIEDTMTLLALYLDPLVELSHICCIYDNNAFFWNLWRSSENLGAIMYFRKLFRLCIYLELRDPQFSSRGEFSRPMIDRHVKND